ncbi:YceG family protein [Priestia endophytica]|uniref:YceG family protein n=1 Tax=Priestia endophytica TaxID=135735 RepID=UPI000DCA8D87|nr:YceG family protein [Priestia endophytica]RAS82915.1 hypothetical protein A4U60_12665 [Priestia endophytica]
MVGQKMTISHYPFQTGSWGEQIEKPLKERPSYSEEEGLAFSTIGARIIGITHDETEYYIKLYELAQKQDVHILSEELDKTISQERFQAIQKIHMVNQRENGLSINRFVAFLEGEQLIPKHENPLFHRHIRLSFMEVLKHFDQHYGFAHEDFRRIFLDLMKWSWNHLDSWLKTYSILEKPPCIVWYGDMNKSQVYFFYYLALLGFDIIIFHPGGEDDFSLIDEKEIFTDVVKHPLNGEIKPFPTEEPERKGTVAYKASQEMHHTIHHEGSSLYKPWQFRDYVPTAVTLKTTYDETFILAKERAFIRPNFSVQNEQVRIPNLFAKIMGVSHSEREYWDRVQTLTEYEEASLVQSFPFTTEIQANYQYHYQHCLNRDGELDEEKMRRSNWWKYEHLPEGLQKGIATAIANTCKTTNWLTKQGETEEEAKLYLFTQITSIPTFVLELMQKFDYAQEVPKLVLYCNEKNGVLSRSDAALLLLLNEFGFDLFLYNPQGHNDLELYLNSECFDTHWLDEMVFGQDFKQPSIFRKVLKSMKK